MRPARRHAPSTHVLDTRPRRDATRPRRRTYRWTSAVEAQWSAAHPGDTRVSDVCAALEHWPDAPDAASTRCATLTDRLNQCVARAPDEDVVPGGYALQTALWAARAASHPHDLATTRACARVCAESAARCDTGIDIFGQTLAELWPDAAATVIDIAAALVAGWAGPLDELHDAARLLAEGRTAA